MYVSIIRPLGYEPNALPLRQFAAPPAAAPVRREFEPHLRDFFSRFTFPLWARKSERFHHQTLTSTVVGAKSGCWQFDSEGPHPKKRKKRQ